MCPVNSVKELKANCHILMLPMFTETVVQQPGFDFSCSMWCALNCFRTGKGLFASYLHTWFLTSSDKCKCGMVQTVSHIVSECPITMLPGGVACKDGTLPMCYS